MEAIIGWLTRPAICVLVGELWLRFCPEVKAYVVSWLMKLVAAAGGELVSGSKVPGLEVTLLVHTRVAPFKVKVLVLPTVELVKVTVTVTRSPAKALAAKSAKKAKRRR